MNEVNQQVAITKPIKGPLVYFERAAKRVFESCGDSLVCVSQRVRVVWMSGQERKKASVLLSVKSVKNPRNWVCVWKC